VSRPDKAEYRSVIGRFPTGVTVVTTCDPDGEPWGLTASSLTSVSLEPLYLLVCIGKGSRSHDVVVAGEHFAVNVLASDSADLSTRFALVDPGDRFHGIDHRTEATGSPVLDRAAAWLDCRVAQLHDAGDHTIVVGEVLACDADPAVDPLVYHAGTYRSLVPA
jgi:flavin reductase (DIM6/NTAB) family NADH-FMN oxidoreductase RutF